MTTTPHRPFRLRLGVMLAGLFSSIGVGGRHAATPPKRALGATVDPVSGQPVRQGHRAGRSTRGKPGAGSGQSRRKDNHQRIDGQRVRDLQKTFGSLR